MNTTTTTTTTATATATLGTVARWTTDIGMLAIDRSREDSCRHASEFCRKTCFNAKLERAFGHSISAKDRQNDEAWYGNDVASLAAKIRRMRNQTARARLMTRGESFRGFDDIARVRAILEATPDTVWWIPSRAWKRPVLWAAVVEMASAYPNARLMASIDPSDAPEMVRALEDAGYSTMFYGDDSATTTAGGARRFLCPKTHKGLKGHCGICKAGCFSTKPVHVHLKQH
ncbi:MAG: hypothetical protein J7D61_07730 [Marichromatium sp.]|nr:hypothetical protein [Marichromatium sp.]